MMQVTKYKLKNGNVKYKVRGYLGVNPKDGKEVRINKSGFNSKKEATLFFNRQKVAFENDSNKYIDGKVKRKFKEVVDEWLPYYKQTVKKNTVWFTTINLEKRILPFFGEMYIDKISISDCQKAIDKWSENYTEYSATLGVVKRIIEFAINRGYCDNNPAEHVILPKHKKKEKTKNFYSKDELKSFLSQLKEMGNDLNYTFFYLLAFTGMRKGEALALKWKDVSYSNRTIKIERTLTQIKSGQIIHDPKTAQSKRTIVIDDRTLKLLKLWKIGCKKKALKNGIPFDELNGFVFSDLNGKPFQLCYFNDKLRSVFKNITGVPKITPHGFRHTHCSLLFESGASIKEVQERLGHSDIKTTMDIYAHVTENAKENTALKFQKYMEN